MADVAKYMIPLQWKEFKVSLPKVHEWLLANAGEQYCGTQAHSILEVWFKEEPSEEVKELIPMYWEDLQPESEEASAYKSQEDLIQERASKKDSAKAKLAALGLTTEEIEALLG